MSAAPSFRCNPDEPAPHREHETKCSKCGKAIVLVNPSQYELEEPFCPLDQIASFEGVCRILGLPRPKPSSASPETIATETEETEL
jgi:hypothetical protein